jgi:hypothetical protein
LSLNQALKVPGNPAALASAWHFASALDWGPKSDCPAYQAFTKSELVKDGKADVTFVNFLADPKKEVRWLGGESLSRFGKTFKTDPALAKKVMAAAQAEKDKSVLKKLGSNVGHLDVSKTGLADDIKKLLAESTSTELRSGIVGSILWSNGKEGGFYDLLQQMARTEKDKEVRKSAAAAFWTGGSDRTEDNCKLWLELSADADDDLAGHSAYHCAFYPHGGGCTGQWDALMDGIEKKSKDGAVKSSFMSSSLGYLYKQAKASDAQKKRAITILRAIVENKSNEKMVRGDALRVIGEHDPDAQAFAAKFESDPEFFVQSAAKKIKEGKK